MHKPPYYAALVLAAVLTSAPLPSLAAIELTCHVGTERIDAVQKQLLHSEGMIPVTSHFRNVGTDEKASWAMATVMMNPSTRRGYEWARMPQGHVCIAKRYINIELMSNVAFRAQSFVDLKSHPNADDVSDGILSISGVNTRLITYKNQGMNPMYRAIVEARLDVQSMSNGGPERTLEFLVSHPGTKAGVLLSAAANGKVLGSYTRVVGLPERDGVRFGAVYSPAAEQMLGLLGR